MYRQCNFDTYGKNKKCDKSTRKHETNWKIWQHWLLLLLFRWFCVIKVCTFSLIDGNVVVPVTVVGPVIVVVAVGVVCDIWSECWCNRADGVATTKRNRLAWKLEP